MTRFDLTQQLKRLAPMFALELQIGRVTAFAHHSAPTVRVIDLRTWMPDGMKLSCPTKPHIYSS